MDKKLKNIDIRLWYFPVNNNIEMDFESSIDYTFMMDMTEQNIKKETPDVKKEN